MENKKLFDDFNSNKISDEDLNIFKLSLNKLYVELSELNQKYINLIRQDNFDKQQKDDLKLEIKNLKAKIHELASTKIFKDNLKNAEKLLKQVKKSKNQADIKKAEEEYSHAKYLFNEYKDAVNEQGRGAKLKKENDIAVEIKNLSFRYGLNFAKAIDNVSFSINKGEYVTIIGHNGSGKSTLSKILIGVLTAQEGEISIFGNKVTDTNIEQIRKFLGIVFQNPDNQFIGSTVEADIAFGLENKRVDPAKMPEIILQAAQKVGMQSALKKEPLNLSGGQKQRVAIASTLALDPDIMIFDEATSMLDPKGKREIKEIMVQLRGVKTIISITHDMDEILNADKVIVLDHAKLVKVGKPLEIVGDKEFLRKIQLDVPFVSLVKEELEKQGINVPNIQNIDELVDKICEV
ncbi:putative cobalt ABC transporter ATP-binding protein [Mycoplasma putrefaciens]|uniref:Cobalt ABC transporter, ATP-binding protein n=1 Tax=Mycoplasma putrefaciens (strain ATCC 15718 / NCTC 10155 / C30 KS-1 / KS-1) TaxID=743965 RepID=A0A7U3ZS74_MYCPK|nr:putative cobalt ABC transporter, ATP-binding protein [Mycoplasma putrefaciens KS1]SYV95294.1 putative cobalt ABC transporter ATP-binding protein [Mycoplasma putrefaciens]